MTCDAGKFPARRGNLKCRRDGVSGQSSRFPRLPDAVIGYRVR